MTHNTEVVLLVLAAITLLVAGVWLSIQYFKGSPDKREQKRRLAVNRMGRLGDAFITEADESLIYYEYSVNGVQYMASQDVTLLKDRLPVAPGRLIGVANLKYTPNNPANSILVCEEWSGLRRPSN